MIRVLAEVWRAGQHFTTSAQFISAAGSRHRLSLGTRKTLPLRHTFPSPKQFLCNYPRAAAGHTMLHAIADFRGIVPMPFTPLQFCKQIGGGFPYHLPHYFPDLQHILYHSMRTCQKIHTTPAIMRSMCHVCEDAVDTISSRKRSACAKATLEPAHTRSL